MKKNPHAIIGLGLAALGRPGYITLSHADDFPDRSVSAMERRTVEMLDLAYEQGIRYFDAARSYGLAEEFLGRWLRANFRMAADEAPFVASKWGYRYTAGWKVDAEEHEVKDHSANHFRSQWEETRSHLGDSLRLYQVHSATRESGILRDEGALTAIAEKRREGVEMGITLSGSGQSDTLYDALDLPAPYGELFSSVQATFNPLEQSASDALAEAAQRGWRVVVKEALANGRLATFGTATTGTATVGSDLAPLRRRDESALDAIVLRHLLDMPFVSVVLSGAARTTHLLSNLKARDIKLSPQQTRLLSSLGEQSREYWETRSKLQWN